tara:strand:+ start:272 stop:547 length:276 start_codon:yes stop_codon:yes gene_type:complete
MRKSKVQKFDSTDDMYEFLLECLESGRLSPEEMMTPDWGVSPKFLIDSSIDAGRAYRAQWMQPLMFLSGIAVGMIGGALLSLEAPIYWLTL